MSFMFCRMQKERTGGRPRFVPYLTTNLWGWNLEGVKQWLRASWEWPCSWRTETTQPWPHDHYRYVKAGIVCMRVW